MATNLSNVDNEIVKEDGSMEVNGLQDKDDLEVSVLPELELTNSADVELEMDGDLDVEDEEEEGRIISDSDEESNGDLLDDKGDV